MSNRFTSIVLLLLMIILSLGIFSCDDGGRPNRRHIRRHHRRHMRRQIRRRYDHEEDVRRQREEEID